MIDEHGEHPPSVSDADLLHAVAAGDTAAFRRLVERHGAALHRLAARLLGSATDAEDVAQEALLRLWRMGGRAGEIAAPAAWLRRVTANLCLDRLRQRQRLAETDAEGLDLVDGAPLADALVEEAQRQGAAQAAIARLPDRQRAAIVLTYYEGLANAAAAQALDMNIKAFESLLVRARTALRADLAATLEGARHDRS